MFNFILRTLGGVVGLLGQTLNLAGGIANIALSIYNPLAGIFNLLHAQINKLTQFYDMSIQTARGIGMPLNQAIAYTKVLTTDTQRLAIAYGVTQKEIAALQQNIAQATGRAQLLNTQQKEGLLQTRNLIEEQNQTTILDQIDKMGGSIDTANSEMLKFVSTSSKSGLVLKTSSKAFAENMAMANRVTFANGIDGVAKMTSLSQKLRFNLSSIESVADKFANFDTAIEASAKLQNLGGMGAALGANPLEMMYEGLNDVEGLTERITKMFESMAVFDKKSGMGKVSGQQLQFIKAQAEAMGMNAEDAVNIAKNGARATAIQGQMGANFDALTSDQQDFLTNKAQWNEKNQRFEVNMLNEKTGEIETRPIDSLSPEDIEKFQMEASMTTTDAVKQSAQQLVTAHEREEAVNATIAAAVADTLWPMLGHLVNMQEMFPHLLLELFKYISGNIANIHWWQNIVIGGVELFFRGVVDIITGAVDLILDGINALCGGVDKVVNGLGSVLRSIGEFLHWDTVKNTGAKWENYKREPFEFGLTKWADKGIKNLFKNAYSDDPSIQSADGVVSAVTDIWNEMKGAAVDVWNKIPESMQKLQQNISGGTSQLHEYAKTGNNVKMDVAQPSNTNQNYSTAQTSIAYNQSTQNNNNIDSAVVPAGQGFNSYSNGTGQMVLNPIDHGYSQVVTSPTPQSEVLVAKPIDIGETINTSNSNTTVNTNNQNVSVEPISVNVNGTIKLDGGNDRTADLDIDRLLNDPVIKSRITNLVLDSMVDMSFNGKSSSRFSRGYNMKQQNINSVGQYMG